MYNRYVKLFFHLVIDAVLSGLTMLLSFVITNNFPKENIDNFIYSILFFSVFFITFNYIFKGYHIIWRFAVWRDYLRIVASSVMAVVFCLIVHRVFEFNYSYDFYTVLLFLNAFSICALRLFYSHISNRKAALESQEPTLRGNIMVIGAGSAGCEVIGNINDKKFRGGARVRCIIDDDLNKKGKYVNGALVIGGRNEIVSAVRKYNIDMIIFAIPTCPTDQKAIILRICQKTGCELRTIPSIYQLLVDKNVDLTTVRKIEIEDLLGRDPIKIDLELIMNYVVDKTVLVTGGGGSIGSELCRQIAFHNPKSLIIFDVYENNAYDIQNELKHTYPQLNLVTLIGSVRDSKRLEAIFSKYRPDIVYHAAAHKHVPLMEDSPNETIKNNVFGTYKTALCAAKYGVKRFILISTDKAVNPTNVMGASKRICEMIIQTFNSKFDTEFVAVRFGNVLGSNGSVIPLFKKQIEEGGPVTVTDPKIIRYFMTIPEAVSLVLQAGATAKGGEIFVLDMGEPVRILDLAENLIRLSGFEPYVDIKIEFTGLRPGEKLYEEMLMSEEGLTKTDNRLIFIGHPIDIDEKRLTEAIEEMRNVMYDDNADIRALIKKIVPTYTYSPSKVCTQKSETKEKTTV
ncbi:MAG: polysaccharide biosynthesis protein [Ruminococcaceae bacterium]|nr:polysaccharide biosynthesis protein [Oscillospiraceae bacterium]